jgi:hypothetical protein
MRAGSPGKGKRNTLHAITKRYDEKGGGLVHSNSVAAEAIEECVVA